MSDGVSTGKSVLIVAVVLGCFAILWPKIFYPMLLGSEDRRGNADHMRPERGPPHGGDEFMHPAMRERNRMLHEGEASRQPRRTIEKELKPGPVPGMRPSMGGPGIQPQGHRAGGGTMGILMPLYTVGIVIFFVYTIMKIAFKKNEEFESKGSASSKSSYLTAEQLSTASSSYQTLNMAAELRRNAHLRAAQQQQQQTADLSQQQARMRQKHGSQQKDFAREYSPNVIREEPEPQDRTDEKRPVPAAAAVPAPTEAQTAAAADRKVDTTKMPDCNECLKEIAESLPESAEKLAGKDPRDMEIQLLKQRLLETERAMAQIVAQMGNMQEITKVATAMAASASTPAPDENSGGDNEKLEDTDAEADQQDPSAAKADSTASAKPSRGQEDKEDAGDSCDEGEAEHNKEEAAEHKSAVRSSEEDCVLRHRKGIVAEVTDSAAE